MEIASAIIDLISNSIGLASTVLDAGSSALGPLSSSTK